MRHETCQPGHQPSLKGAKKGSAGDKPNIWNWNGIGVINPLSIAANSQDGKRTNVKSIQI